MSFVSADDGIEIFYKDWDPKEAQPIHIRHDWPLSADGWDAQMLFFLGQGFRVMAHDRRGHGRSTQVSDGHDMDHCASDAAAVVGALDLQNVVHVEHSTGGGQVARYVPQHGQAQGRAARAALIALMSPPFETDRTADFRAITVPTLILQGDDDQVVPCENAALKQHELIAGTILKVYPGVPHGMHSAPADEVNANMPASIHD